MTQVLPGQHAARLSLARLRSKGVQACLPDPRHTDLGTCAEALRKYLCDGTTAALRRPDLMAKMYLAFASITVGRASRTEATYIEWVQQLATREYADELAV